MGKIRTNEDNVKIYDEEILKDYEEIKSFADSVGITKEEMLKTLELFEAMTK